MRAAFLFASSLAFALAASPAPAAAPVAPAPRELAPVVVSGVLPGPKLWKVTKGDHVLWILGTLTPAPKRMEWESREASKVVAASGGVLLGARASVRADVGLIRGAMMLPKALKARDNPDGKTLRDVLPAATYSRWTVLRARYLGRDLDIERKRPIFAAQALYEAAIRHAGLDPDNQVAPKVKKLARRHDVPTHLAEVDAVLTEPKAALKAFAGSSLEDVACFEQTLDRVEADVARMAERANAWAVGDLGAMRALPYADHNPACLSAVLDTAIAREHGLEDLPGRVRTAWVDEAEKLLVAHPQSLALLPMSEILKPDGYLAALQARGYAVEAPADAP